MTNDSSVKNEKNDDAVSFLGALFANVHVGWVSLFTKRGKESRTKWLDLAEPNAPQSLQQAAERASAAGWDSYVSICPASHRGANGARIKQEDAAIIPAYFMDVDVGKPGCPSSLDEAQKTLEALPFPPGMAVCSGYGIHAYWLLKTPVSLDGETRRGDAAHLRQFADAVAAYMGYEGLDTHASEVARVLRIPGTNNYKHPAAPVPVFLLPSSGERCDVEQLNEWARSVLPPADEAKRGASATNREKSNAAPGAGIPDARVLDLAGRGKNGALFTHLMNGVTSDYGGDQSRADMELCGLLAFYTGCDAAQMDRLFRQSLLCRDKWDEKRGATTYGEMTIQEAIKHCAVCYTPRNAAFDFDNPSSEESPLLPYAKAYEAVPPYFVSEHGELCYLKKDRDTEIAIKLASFACLIDEERKLDNGQDEPVLQFHIQGRAAGRVLPPFSIGAREFQAMGWPLEKWGTRANVVPGQAVKDKLRYAIGEASGALVRRVNVYTHTGFRKIGGAWAYLYHGDAIGADDVQVDLSGDGLEAFSLEVVNGLSREEALKGSLSLRGCMADRVALPLLAYAYLAPLCSFLIDSACAPAFTVFLKGRTQTRKTTAAVLCQQHFGAAFNARRLPASFEDTLNSIREKAFALKDAVLLVDDAHPVSSQKERDKLADTINALASAWGERKGRGRCGADGRNTQARPPRGLGLLTGEDLPGTNESALSRFFVVEVGEGDVPKGDALTAAQEKGAGGVFCQAMRGYIEWLAGQGDSLLKTLGGLFDAYRKEAMRRGRLRDRLYEAVAQLRTGIEMLARYGTAVGALTDGEADGLRAAALACFYELATAQTADIAQESPSVLFIEALRDLLGNRTNTLCAIGSPGGARLMGGVGFLPNPLDIGFHDGITAYLNPGQAYAAVQEYFRRQGRTFPLSKGTLFKRLADEGLCQVNPGKTGADYYAWPKNCGGRSVRVVRIPLKSVLPAETPENDEQMEWERIS